MGRHAPFYTSHSEFPFLAVRQEKFDDIIAVCLKQDQALTRGALAVLRTTTHEMAAVGGTRFDMACASHAEAFFGPAMGLHFGHFFILYS
jgi:hypothetical protein